MTHMPTPPLRLTLSGLCGFDHLCPRVCVGVWPPWTVKDANAVISARPCDAHVCIYARVACTYMRTRPCISACIWFNSLSCPIQRQFITPPPPPHVLLSAPVITTCKPLLIHIHSPSPLLFSLVRNLLQGDSIWFTVDLMRKNRGVCVWEWRKREIKRGGEERNS